MAGIERVCQAEGCGRSFIPCPCNGVRQRFCSDACRKRVWGRDRYRTDPVFRARRNQRNRDYHDGLSGLALARRQLQQRRVKALARQSARHARREATKEG